MSAEHFHLCLSGPRGPGYLHFLLDEQPQAGGFLSFLKFTRIDFARGCNEALFRGKLGCPFVRILVTRRTDDFHAPDHVVELPLATLGSFANDVIH